MWHICMCLSVLCIYVGVCVCFFKENLHATWKLIRLKGLLHSSGSSALLGLGNGFCGWGVGSWQTNTHTKFGNWSGQTLFHQRFANGSAGRAWSLLLHIPPLCLSISRARHSPPTVSWISNHEKQRRTPKEFGYVLRHRLEEVHKEATNARFLFVSHWNAPRQGEVRDGMYIVSFVSRCHKSNLHNLRHSINPPC